MRAAETEAGGRPAAPTAEGRRPLHLRPVLELPPERFGRLYRRSALVVVLAMLAFTVLFTVLAYLKYRAYMDARFDLGNMVQAVYNTAHGRFLEITTGELEPRQMSRLGSHVDPILALFALPWLVWPSPVMLLLGQALIVATGAWPVYRLGVRVVRDPRAAACLAGAYLLYPATGFLVLNEFHPVALATPLLLWAFVALEEERWWRAAVFLVLAALCKETVPLSIGLMGAYFAWRKRSWKLLVISAAAAIYFVVAVWVIIPHYNQGQSAFIARYGEYGGGAGAVVRTMLTDPVQTATDLLAGDNLLYWARLLGPLALTPLLSPLTALLAAPELLLNALSATGFQRRIEFHYTALAIPFLVAAAVLGLMRLWRWLGGGVRCAERDMPGERVGRLTLAGLVLVCCLAANVLLGPIPFPFGSTYTMAQYARVAHDAVLDEAVALIPAGVTVSVNNNAGAQLAARRIAYVFPAYDQADWVLVDERHPFVFDKEIPAEHRQAVLALLDDPAFERVFEKDGVAVFRRVFPLPD